jgi:tRNA uridine 5-carboxymethylaminomethyl modification enzyme
LFTSRAEYRLALREDNAIDRLTEYANQYGLISESEYQDRTALFSATEDSITKLRKQRVPLADFPEVIQRFKQPEAMIAVEKLLTQPEMTIEQAMPVLSSALPDVPQEALERAAIQIRYRGYVEKQEREIQKFKQMERERIPSGFSFQNIRGLKKEAWEKFQHFQPASIGQAGRIEGITPADVAVLSVHIKRYKQELSA